MAKNIVICSDGTGNSGIVGRGTNVFKLFEAVDLNGHRWDPALDPQLAFYDDGVGSQDLKPLRIIGGAAGWGLSTNVRQLYKELARVYDPGDRIYMFGFSRGAFTVRSLVGLIGTCGLVNSRLAATAAEFDDLVDKAYAAYRACYRTAVSRLLRGQPNRDAGAEFRQAYAIEERTRIRFLGVWDTVDAVGLPFHLSDIVNTVFYRFKFPDAFLSDSVDKACHALSIDDDRHSFHPLVWDEGREDVNANRIEQVWFAGVHSNVGGGYPKQGLSLVALDWMMAKAELSGLRFNDRDREQYHEHASVDDKLYDPRAGLGTFYRWKPRDVWAICREHHMPARVHLSAIERIAHGVEHYAPVNLPAQLTVVTSPADRRQDAALMAQRASNVEAVCHAAMQGGTLLGPLQGTLWLGRLSYYVFLLTCTTAVAGVALHVAGTRPGMPILTIGADWAGAAISQPLHTGWESVAALWRNPLVFWTVVAGLMTASALSRVTDRRISRTASGFWYTHQKELRTALKAARCLTLATAPAVRASSSPTTSSRRRPLAVAHDQSSQSGSASRTRRARNSSRRLRSLTEG